MAAVQNLLITIFQTFQAVTFCHVFKFLNFGVIFLMVTYYLALSPSLLIYSFLHLLYLTSPIYSGFPKETPELKFRLRFFPVQPQFVSP